MAPRKKAEKKTPAGKISISDIRSHINKKIGNDVVHSLAEENPSDVKEWIPTGALWLDGIICRGKMAGIPVGKVSSIAGLEGTGKSYLAAQTAANAQKQGFIVVYFDSESAIDSNFLRNIGCNVDDIIYQQALFAEDVLETIEELMSTYPDQKFLFIWDSLSNTPSRKEDSDNFDPQKTMALIPRILSVGFKKLTIPIANHNCALLVLQQLKTRIASNPGEAMDIMVDPYFEPGGKAMKYATSLHIRLTNRKAKSAFVKNSAGFDIGNEVKAKINKSRFGTRGRECVFRIIWGEDDVRILNDESLLDAIMSHEDVLQNGSWLEIKPFPKFQPGSFVDKLNNTKGFRERVMEIFEEQVIQRFNDKTGNAAEFYSLDGDGEVSDNEGPVGE
jgi:RecA/RadA recombinase